MRYLILLSSLNLICPLLTAAEKPLSTPHMLSHAVHNLETELSYLKQKIENQETVIETLREEIIALVQATKEATAKSSSVSDGKLQQLEKNIDKLIVDMKQFKTHTNATAELANNAQKTLQEQATLSRLQSKQLGDLESAMKSLAKAMQSGVSSSKETGSHYFVRADDTLAKIAKECNTTVRELKELNGLRSDKIVIGQELKTP